MKFKLEIECDNAAFELDPKAEVASILERMCSGWLRRNKGSSTRYLFDTNGNTVGWARFEDVP